ncbi:hypothetical protein WN944_001489 [Citrus x changshan-huyou]|uniref:PHD-type domain-containing protein n=1 Tax=Citrus x changshan-huyou TaxID=2935761 RepID=A0AAP0QRF3_9ROSI
MQLSTASSSSPKKRDGSVSGPRLRKKHKRLDAICEEEYAKNHSEPNEDDDEAAETGSAASNLELRRSSRVRRAPVLLDVSPSPVKKRRKMDKTVNLDVSKSLNSSRRSAKEKDNEKSVSPGVWGSRLRSRGRNVGFGAKSDESGHLSRRRKLFREMDEDAESEIGMEKGSEGGDLVVSETDKLDRFKELNDLGGEPEKSGQEEEMHEKEEEVGTSGMKEESGRGEELEVVRNEGEDSKTIPESVVGNEGEDSKMIPEGVLGVENVTEVVEADAKVLIEEEETKELSDKELKEDCIGDENVEVMDTTEKSDKERMQFEDRDERENHRDGGEHDGEDHRDGGEHDGEDHRDGGEHDEVEDHQIGGEHNEGEDHPDGGEHVRISTSEVKDGSSDHQKDDFLAMLEEKPVECENAPKVDAFNHGSDSTLGWPRIKQGRRCGLCGCGNDGKPPKRLIQDAGDSENEVYSGSSASEEPNYDIWDGFGDEPGWLGRLLGPINDRYGIAGTWVHQHCAVWSPEVYFAGLGCLKNIRAALCRGRALKCTRCGRPGATIGCRVDRCPRTYHLPCARANGCIFDHRKFLIACTDHRHLFQPYGNQYLARIKKLKARKMKMEIRKLSNDAWRKDMEAEEKWLENCGEDEEFLKREGKRLHRDLLRIAPVYIGGSDSDSGKLFEGFESVAGLQDVIRCMKEVVILPLLYPEFFDNLGLTPPRGVLLHGHPGTGKTLVVRALIGSCARGDKRIAYFARKGADCLGKYVGDAERQLRLLFQVAEKCQPSIIFFDEIDGLAPCRTRQQDQTHSSVVSTLLALMDGLKSRGSVVVIGATNRPEAVDPALRRPGRFDREIYFPLPSMEDRAAILSLHTQRWPKPVTGSLLKWIAARTAGFAGADLQALCTQAAIIALKRNFPLQEILSAAAEKASGSKRVTLPSFAVEERDWLEALSCSPPPCSKREAGIAAHDLVSSPLPSHLIPCLLQPLSTLLVSLYLDERLWLPPSLTKAAKMIQSVIVSALDKKKLLSDHWWSHINDFLEEADIAKEIERRLQYAGIITREASFAGLDAFAGDSNDDCANSKPSIAHSYGINCSLLQNISCTASKGSGFRVLISGSPGSGQRHLAACLLHSFIGNVEIQKVDLATISQEGRGDLVQGLTLLLMKCSTVGSCFVFMPRVDLWAVETLQQGNEESDSCATNDDLARSNGSCFADGQFVEKDTDSWLQQHKSEGPTEFQGHSHAWSTFVEQVESICVSTSLMILATSEVPYLLLPKRVRQFFESHTSNCSLSIPLEHPIPRFCIQLGGNFNCDRVINLSAAELARDVTQLVVQSIHQRTHPCETSWKVPKDCGFTEVCTDTEFHNTSHGNANEHEVKTQCPDDFSVRGPPPPNNRTLKGKSSLVLAISTFGNQILRYPHFAELCWVTSKLKEGPCADISGSWKGWPFNSCIIHPNDSVEKVVVACGSTSIKCKEKYGLVRGLIAVGLSAYRGVYVSLREVSSDVRRVLELLVGEINAKVQAGKDRYQYVRLLSQVAYLEDVVNNWAYALQSLESDALVKASPKLNVVGCAESLTCTGNLVQTEESKQKVSEKGIHESEGTEGRPDGAAAENLGGLSLNSGDSDTAGRDILIEEGSSRHNLLPDTLLDKNLHNSPVADQSTGNTTKEQNGTNLGPCESERTGNIAVDTNSESLKHSNGFAFQESVVISQNGPCSASELGATVFSDSQKSCDQINGFSMTETEPPCNNGEADPWEHTVDVDFSSRKTTSLSTDSGIVCMYRCCTECVCTLHNLMKKILIHTLGLSGSDWTAEDVHNVVASLSVDLLSAVGKVYFAGCGGNDIEEDVRCEDPELSECPELSTCCCKSSGNCLDAPMECSCHSLGGGVTEASTSTNTHLGFDPKFVLRDGILVPVDSITDGSFHCTFETLCLCSLIKSLVMMKQPFD